MVLELSPGFCPGVRLLFQCGWPKALPGLSLSRSRGATTPSWHAAEKVTAPGLRRVALAPAFPSVDQFSSSVFCFQGKFLAFYQYAKSFNSDDFDYAELKDGDYVFMRWKEQFLVPDHTIKDISGASFAGFYYICFQKSAASIEGYYYHRSSEWYQSLNLTHVPEHSAPIYEFR